jgi:hypothetical protein
MELQHNTIRVLLLLSLVGQMGCNKDNDPDATFDLRDDILFTDLIPDTKLLQSIKPE